MDNNDEFITLLNEMYRQKVWTEVVQSFGELTEEEQEVTLNEFARITDQYGDDSKELFDFFHKQSMTHSRTYYFIHTLGEETSWDDAVKELQ